MQALLKKTRKVENPLVWIDCEMTGLDVFGDDHIIEVCCIITDGDLNIIDEEGYESTVYFPKERLDQMDEWCTTQHNASGLVTKILENPQQTMDKVAQDLTNYIMKYVPQPRTGILAGNSVHMDKIFLMKDMPQVTNHLHYRLVDVSTIMEFGRRHNPELMKCCPKKVGAHTAKADILESIAQLEWYRDFYFKDKEESAETITAFEEEALLEILEDASRTRRRKEEE
ncbi:ribonuclease H-like domain-containing protein [Scheffersomyces xylosifermentans]|uniref:ribonuclease H-like domain-containing protein n=1 Tax=Scheffersomyces xylosifermentans TaxID=1304137 RepID=UPI00315DE5FB